MGVARGRRREPRIAGFFLIEAADLSEAVEIAKRCPHAEIGPVEVREVMEVGPPRG